MAGGKLTGYRKMAERVLDQLIGRTFSERELGECETHKIRLFGSDFKNYQEVQLYSTSLEKRLLEFQLPPSYANYLVSNYGKQTELILDDLQPGDPDGELAKAELRFTIHHEMVVNPLDFFIRRTGMLYFDKNRMKKVRGVVEEELKRLCNWDLNQYERERLKVDQVISGVTIFN
jgi:glycerol-3-phosphate dehydrogenase